MSDAPEGEGCAHDPLARLRAVQLEDARQVDSFDVTIVVGTDI